MSDSVKPVPQKVRDDLEAALRDLGKKDMAAQRWMIRRLVESTWTAGYMDGFGAGFGEARADSTLDRAEKAVKA